METFVQISLLLAVLGVLAYLAFFKSTGSTVGDNGSELLIADLRRQLGEANATAERERNAKADALSRASGAESARNAAAQQLTEAQQANGRAIEQLRADNAKAQAEAEARYNKALADLRITFEKTSSFDVHFYHHQRFVCEYD